MSNADVIHNLNAIANELDRRAETIFGSTPSDVALAKFYADIANDLTTMRYDLQHVLGAVDD